MLAGMQLDVFTPMREGPMTPDDIAHAIGVKADRLRLLLWALVAAGLLTEKDGRFSNTQETNQFLVKGVCRRLKSIFPIRHRRNWRHSSVGSIRTQSQQHIRCWSDVIFRPLKRWPM